MGFSDGFKRMMMTLGLILVAVARVGLAENPASSGSPMQITLDENVLSIQSADRVLLRYHYQNVPFKPYVQELFTPHGQNILRDAPADHLHHHGLMFAVGVNKVSFWQETPDAGRQVHRSFTDVRVLTHNNSPCAGFTEQLDWIGPAGQEPLLNERRCVEVLHSTEFGATVVSWQSSLGVPPGKKAVTLDGAHYYGLGMRFLESMDKGGEFLNGGTDSVEVVRGDERNFRSTWCAYTAHADGKPVTVAMFDRPDNPRHPATWFIMSTPFAYLSATMNVRKQPLEVTEQNPIAVRYGIALWDGRVEADEIARACRWWVERSSPDNARTR